MTISIILVTIGLLTLLWMIWPAFKELVSHKEDSTHHE